MRYSKSDDLIPSTHDWNNASDKIEKAQKVATRKYHRSNIEVGDTANKSCFIKGIHILKRIRLWRAYARAWKEIKLYRVSLCEYVWVYMRVCMCVYMCVYV